jgi:hypothetical protein
MYKWIERTAWITGSLGVAGVFFIFFLQGIESWPSTAASLKSRRPAPKQRVSRPLVKQRVEQQPAVYVVPPKPEPIPQPEKETPNPAETKKPETIAPVIKAKVKPVVKTAPPEVEETPGDNTPGRLFAESELNQLVGKIQAAHIKAPELTNCVQIRITRNNNNAQSVTQVERFLTDRGYIITGREKEDFLKGSGIKVVARGRCVSVTVGTK